MKTFLQTGVFTQDGISVLSNIKEQNTIIAQTSPNNIIRNETKQSLFITLKEYFILFNHTLIFVDHDTSFALEGMNNDIVHLYSDDYVQGESPQGGISINKIYCYESSLTYMIARRYIAMNTNNYSLAKEVFDNLSKYIGDSDLATVYTHNSLMKEDSLNYFNLLTKPTKIKTADIIPYRFFNGKKQILLGTRNHYPTGISTIGGFVDYNRQNNNIQSDIEIMELYDFPDVTIVTALREGLEEMGKHVSHLQEARQYGVKYQGSASIYRIKQGDMCIEINSAEQMIHNTIIEDPRTMQLPTDPRGLVSTVFYIARIVSDTISGSEEIGNLTRYDLEEVNNLDFAMNHHQEFLKNVSVSN